LLNNALKIKFIIFNEVNATEPFTMEFITLFLITKSDKLDVKKLVSST